ncbi:MAG: hypothetical protein ACM3VZ_11350 [Acidobacteriota bacterium]
MPRNITVTFDDGSTHVYQQAPDNITPDQVSARAQRDFGKSVVSLDGGRPAAVEAGAQINQIPRQLGLFARYGIEGIAGVPEMLTEPIRQNITDPLLRYFNKPTVSDLVTGKKAPQGRPLSQEGAALADWMGLPKPEGANERVIGDMTKMGFSAMGTSGLMNKAAGVTSNVAKDVFAKLAANPGQQVISAVGAGGAAGASREAGGDPWMQAGAALLGGVAAPAAVNAVKSAATSAKNFTLNRFAPKVVDRNVDNTINLTLQRSGIDWNDIDAATRRAVRADVSQALQSGQELNGDALRRLIDFRRTGVTPTLGSLTLDPVQITREKNLAKMGANTSDASLQRLAQVENQNNSTLIRNMNDAGATRGDVLNAGETVAGAVLSRRDALRNAEQAAWQEARNSPSYRQPISSSVLSDINQALDSEGLMPFMDQRISSYMSAFQSGKRPFTPQDYRNLQSMLSKEMSAGGNQAAAAGVARNILERADMRPAGPVSSNLPITGAQASQIRMADLGAESALDAVNRARAATRQAYAFEDSNPLVRSVLSDGASSDPARIAQRFVIGGTPNEARDVANQLDAAGRNVVRDSIVAHLKEKALSGAADEVGNFSQSAYNKALHKIGDRKLALFFTPEEIDQLRTVGRVASYTQFQPRGSAVNNSNSGAMLAGNLLDFMGTAASRLPLGLKDTVTGTISGMQARRALSPARGLLIPPEPTSFADAVGPSLLYGGLLTAPQIVPNR